MIFPISLFYRAVGLAARTGVLLLLMLLSAVAYGQSYDLELVTLAPSKSALAPGEAFTISYEIRNQGSGAASRITSSLEYFICPDHPCTYTTQRIALTYLAPGGMWKDSVDVHAPQAAGSYVVRMNADAWSTPTPRTQKQFTITVGAAPPPAPDLQLSDLKAADIVVRPGHKLRLSFSTRNAGNIASGVTAGSIVILRSGVVMLSTPFDFQTVAPGATLTMSVESTVPAERGDYTAEVRIGAAPAAKAATAAVPFTVRADGITVITHGYLLGGTPTWMLEMACGIAVQAKEARVFNHDPASGKFEPRVCGSQFPFQEGNEGEAVLVFNWPEDSTAAVAGFSEAAGDALFAALMRFARENERTLGRLHFIGHSRGTVVNSEAIERILASGQAIDDLQMTTLDTHDWGIEGWILDDYDVNPFPNGVVVWKGVTFADNYYQQQEPLTGRFVQGSNNEELHYDDIMPCSALLDVLLLEDSCHTKVHVLYQDSLVPGKGKFTWYSYSRVSGGQRPQGTTPDTGPRFRFESNGIMNGDFIKGWSYAGWTYQGGGGDGQLVEQDNQFRLRLKPGQSRTHNWFYIPPDAKSIQFELRTVLLTPDALHFMFDGDDIRQFDCAPASDAYLQCSVPLTDLDHGRTRRMTFWTPDIAVVVESTNDFVPSVLIGNVGFEWNTSDGN